MIIGPVSALGTAWKQRKDIVDTAGTVNKKRAAARWPDDVSTGGEEFLCDPSTTHNICLKHTTPLKLDKFFCC